MNSAFEQTLSLAELEQVFRRRICAYCVDRNLTGGPCALEAHGDCALFDRLPRVAQAISRVHSNNIDEYVAAIRENICDECIHQRLDGSCGKRDEVRCALDRYLPLIVEALEEVQERRAPTEFTH